MEFPGGCTEKEELRPRRVERPLCPTRGLSTSTGTPPKKRKTRVVAPPVLAADESREKVWLDYKRSANGPYRC